MDCSLEVLLEVLPVNLASQEGRLGHLTMLINSDLVQYGSPYTNRVKRGLVRSFLSGFEKNSSLEVLLEVLPVHLTSQEGRLSHLPMLVKGDLVHQHSQFTLCQLISQALQPIG